MGTPGDQRRLKHLNDSERIHPEDQRNDDNTPQPVAAATETTIVQYDGAIKTEPLDAEQEQESSESDADVDLALDLDVAGPSGLQTPKSKSNRKSAANDAPKKHKKSAAKKPHVCGVCQKCFQSLSKYAKHQQAHGSGSPFKCEHCKKSFSSKFKLVRHVLIHSDRKPFSCTLCERTFHRKDHLKNHIKVHSPCKKLYVCHKSACKKEYTSLISFKKHLAFHAAEDGDLTCLICEKSFATKEDILYHLKVHAGSRTVKNPEEKKYCCDHCQRKFFTRKDVRRHMVVHTGRRDFLCQFCPQRFGRKDHLVRHIKKSHLQTTVKEEETADAGAVSIKTEADESSLSQPENFSDNLDLDLLWQPLPLPLQLPLTQGELADLGREVLDVIPPSLAADAGEEDLLTTIDDIPDTIISYLEESEARETAPLPAFSQIFHHQPTQSQPQPPQQSQQPPQPPPRSDNTNSIFQATNPP